MTGYVWKFEGSTTISFKISNKQLLKKCNQIWKKVEKLLKIEFDSKPVYGDDDKYIKTKIKIYGGIVNVNFQSRKMPKEKAPCKCLSLIMLDSVIKAKKKYFPYSLFLFFCSSYKFLYLSLACSLNLSLSFSHYKEKMKISIKDFFSKCNQIRRKQRIWSHLLKKSLMQNFIFCAVS